MKHTLISPNQFKTIPWKNGKGNTVELAINDGATLDNFTWRISMADVVEDGEFSDFSGYLRNLVLIKGSAITLEHDKQNTDALNQYLRFATFNGGNKTVGKLPNGPITDFNIITCINTYDVEVFTHLDKTSQPIPDCDLAFVYSLGEPVIVKSNNFYITVASNHLLKVDMDKNAEQLSANGGDMIIVCLTQK
ncbi:HutD family protein [Thalassotalea sp. Y01]|uniref:HutD/Ves family protein n=1 Tax=Thalassotalea sp. Y01 TaxID=2729613 RepID=UPI00145D91E3|nr:HutD family protein [Thalassotalea sp. Y01]NMP15595.1 HutD family protein [Thalassotalea sp. Y01]